MLIGILQAYAEFFQEVESSGLDAIWVEDRVFHPAPLADSLLLLLWAAAHTRRLLLGAAVLIALAGLCGDLFASRLKRRVDVKDYGETIPTQGGILDVYDAFIFVTPAFYYYLLWTAP